MMQSKNIIISRIQSKMYQLFPPYTICGLILYSSTKYPKLYISFNDITKLKKLILGGITTLRYNCMSHTIFMQ